MERFKGLNVPEVKVETQKERCKRSLRAGKCPLAPCRECILARVNIEQYNEWLKQK